MHLVYANFKRLNYQQIAPCKYCTKRDILRTKPVRHYAGFYNNLFFLIYKHAVIKMAQNQLNKC
ncbi:hypothetical protein D172_001165 [Pseudoalteromonas sp. Bsw20308]|nr:hypothetical protein D172_001165 [Pseudoalteromonas sp. Bsw20308]